MPSQDQNPIKITIILPTHAYFTAGIRDFTMGFIKNTTQFGEKWAYRFQLIVDELCNNAIEYGSTTGKDIKISFYYDHKSMEVSVEDTGTAENKTTAEALSKLVDERKNPAYINKELRGRGLSKIVANWTDELKFEKSSEGGIKVTAKKLLNNPPQAIELAPQDKTHIILQ